MSGVELNNNSTSQTGAQQRSAAERFQELGGDNLLDAGLRAAKRGWKIFPCNTQKKPLIKWREAATTDPIIITAWSKWRLVAMWARALPEDVVVIDLDRKHGLNGVREFERLHGYHPDEFDAPRVITATAGIHVYTDPTNRDFKNSVSAIAPGVDTKTHGGYCIIPSGDGFYRWLSSPDVPLPSTPHWVETALRRESNYGPWAEAQSFQGLNPYGDAMLSNAVNAIASAANGTQELTLGARSLIIGHYVGGGLLEYAPTIDKLIAAGMLMINFDAHKPWTAKQIREKVIKAVNKGMKQPMDGEEAFRAMREVHERYFKNPQLHDDVMELLLDDEEKAEEQPSQKESSEKPEPEQARAEQPEEKQPDEPWLKFGERLLIRRMGKGVPKPVAFFIDGLFHEVGTGIIASKWFGGKTYVVMGVAASGATGKPFAGREVLRKGAVLWLAAEGEREVDLRIRAAIKALGCDPDDQPVYVQTASVPKLLSNGGEAAVMAIVSQAQRAAEVEFGAPLVLVVFDTMIKSAGYRKSENDSIDINNTIIVMENIAIRGKCFVLALDHMGKNEDLGARGSSDKPSSTDVYIELKSNGASRIFHALKIKGEKGDDQIEFKIVGAIENEQTTAVIQWGKWNGSDEAAKNLNSNARVLLECVRQRLTHSGFGLGSAPPLWKEAQCGELE